MATENEKKDIISNIQSEICLVGSIYKSPDLYVSYGNYIRSKYDFYDEVTRFLYDCFELYYKSFSQSVSENKINTFMSSDIERLKQFKKYGGWKIIQQWMQLSDESDFKNYFNLVKKYSLLREYQRYGYPVDKLIAHRYFEKWTAKDIYKLIRSQADKINTIINASEESILLNDNNEKKIKSYISRPNMGLSFPWELYNELFLGCRLGKVLFQGFLSNEGKSRNLMMFAAYITLVLGEKFLFMSNEMDEEDMRSCLITTVINNPEFKELHQIDIIKPERELVLGIYRDKNGTIIQRQIDNNGNYVESEEQFEKRLLRESDEYNSVIRIGQWIDKETKGKLYFKDVSSDYSDETLEFECRKHQLIYGINYCGYDTLKGYKTDEWASIKQTATKLKELMNEIKMFAFMPFQLTDDTVFTDIFQLSSNNIANCKGIKHIADMLTLGKRIKKDEYYKYEYISLNDEDWGEPVKQNLNIDKTYFAIKVDKNRGGSKDKIILFEINLDLNIWNNIGILIKKEKK